MTIDVAVPSITFINGNYNVLYRLNRVPVKAIAFDVWNTLLDIGVIFNQIAYIVSNRFNSDIYKVAKCIAKAYSYAKKLRRYSDIDGLQIVFESQKNLANMINVDMDELLNIIDEAFKTVDINKLLFNDVIETLKILKRLDFKIGIIGNTIFWNSSYTKKILKQLGVLNYIDIALFSDEIRINKPDKKIFLDFSKAIGIEPEYIAYVGDSIVEDVGGALSAGMKAIYIDRSREKKIILGDLGIAIITNLLEVIDAIEEF